MTPYVVKIFGAKSLVKLMEMLDSNIVYPVFKSNDWKLHGTSYSLFVHSGGHQTLVNALIYEDGDEKFLNENMPKNFVVLDGCIKIEQGDV